jgi:hypothetical protein
MQISLSPHTHCGYLFPAIFTKKQKLFFNNTIDNLCSGDCACVRACVISGFRREVDENCALLVYYAASGEYLLSTFGDNLSVLSSRVKDKKDGTDTLSRNVGKKLPILAA